MAPTTAAPPTGAPPTGALTIGIDIGTTSTIGIAIDTAGRVLALASRPVDLASPHPGWAEEDPRQWWANVRAIVPELLRDAAIRSEQVAAVGVTGMLPAAVLLDDAGALLRPSIQQSDGRTGAEVDALARQIDAAPFLARTGQGITQQLVAPKLRWLARHEPAVFARIATVFGSYDFINWKLTGHRGTERNWALEAGFLDLATDDLAPDLVALGGVPASAVPRARAAQDVIGTVSESAARETGLAAGTKVIAGCADHVASAFVAGIVDPGDLLIKFGGAGDILLSVAQAMPDRRLFLDYHLIPGRFMPNGCMAASGAVLNWIRREFAPHETHRSLDARAAALPPGADGLVMLPYFLGEKTPIHDPAARGTLVGLGLHHTIGHVWRAALEAVCFGFRHHVEVMRALGYDVSRVVASDGGAASPVWMQIAADVLGQPVQLLAGHPGSCLGAAYAAGVGVGAIADWGAIDRFVARASVVAPDAGRHAAYTRIYAAYREVYDRLHTLYPRLT
ncbi:MAG: FGGY-family carbohydrate kinase [Alphaproteobacteria bacterium]|nr:FGGY-family carbohydrate kinase [Alphaproteobacteria bacterium]